MWNYRKYSLMFVQFRLKNFMSFRDEHIFSLVAANGLREKDDRLSTNVVVFSEQIELLKTAVVYGANASGKSNLLQALDFYTSCILLSPRPESAIESYSPFALDEKSATEPTLLEAIFTINDVIYRYGFELQQQAVISEWLFTRRKQEAYVFERKANEVRVNRPYKKLHELQSNQMIASTNLLLPLGALFNDETCKTVQTWASNCQCVEGTKDYKYKNYTVQYLQKPENKQRILDLLRNADLGIEDIELVQQETDFDLDTVVVTDTYNAGSDWVESNPKAYIDEIVPKLKAPFPQGSFRYLTAIKPLSNFTIRTKRLMWDATSNTFKSVSKPLNTFESQGTQKFFNLIGLILLILDSGGILIADELDTKLHPLLTQRLVQLFNNSETNPRNAQFIFTTHDTNLLSAGLFRRDQIWFTEKDTYGATQLYALTDYKPGGKTVRNDEQLEKNYIAGKYGGIPYLGNFDALFEKQPLTVEAITNE